MATLSNNTTIKYAQPVSANISVSGGGVNTVWQNSLANSYAIVNVLAGGGYSFFNLYIADSAGQAVAAATSFVILSNTTRNFADNIHVPAGKFLLLSFDTPGSAFAKVSGVHFVNTP